jgi:cytochrome c5
MRIPSGRITTLFVAFLAVAQGAFAPAFAADADGSAIKAHLKQLDSGPKTIDVAKYPADQKAGYKLFATKCSKCHTLARPINSDFVLPAQWERYIKRMTFKPNSQISDTDGKKIYRFLVYDASVRKRDQLRKALSSLSAEREEAINKIKSINPAFTAP